MSKYYVKSGSRCLIVDRPTARTAAESMLLRSIGTKRTLENKILVSERGFESCEIDENSLIFDVQEMKHDCLIDTGFDNPDEFPGEENDDDYWG